MALLRTTTTTAAGIRCFRGVMLQVNVQTQRNHSGTVQQRVQSQNMDDRRRVLSGSSGDSPIRTARWTSSQSFKASSGGSRTMSTAKEAGPGEVDTQPDPTKEGEEKSAKESQAQGLPAPGEGDKTWETNAKLDVLGPIVVNRDGTVGRVANWDEMTEAERATTMRLLKVRNAQRIKENKAKGVGGSTGADLTGFS